MPVIGRAVKKQQKWKADLKKKAVEKQIRAAEKKIAQRKAAEAKPRIVVERPVKALKPGQCRVWLRRTVAKAFPDVVEGFLNEAAKGGCAHLKLLSETVATAGGGKGSRTKGPAALMMEEIEREFPRGGEGWGRGDG